MRESGIERVASVIHLAAYFDMTGEPSPLYRSVTIEGTAHLPAALGALPVEQFVYASTMLVHVGMFDPALKALFAGGDGLEELPVQSRHASIAR